MNKKIYSFGLAAMMLLCSGNVMATDYYLSATGNDANDGLTAATALKTLSAIMAKAQQNKDGEHIYVSGIIKVDAEWTKAHYQNIIFEGTDPEKDGFDAEGKNGIFNLNNTIATFKNLSFKNGYQKDTHAGAIWGAPLKLTLENCVFEGNKTDGANANQCAGAVFVSGKDVRTEKNGGGIFATNCKFINNTCGAGGGAIVAGSNLVELKNCYFQNNVAANNGGAIYGNTIQGMNVDACTFEGNESTTSRGGAIYIYMNTTTERVYSVTNSTFYQNKAKGEGGAFSASDQNNASNNTINFVHCTMTANSTQGTVEGAGGIAISGKPGLVNIVNSILQGNLALTNANSFADATFKSTKVKFVNSYVGSIRKFEDYSDDSYTFDKNSVLNNLTSSSAEIDLGEYDATKHIIPLKATSNALTAADLSADAAYGVTADQQGTPWTKAYLGAVQLSTSDISTGIAGIKANAAAAAKGIYNIQGQYVGKDASKLAKGVYVISGKKVIVK